MLEVLLRVLHLLFHDIICKKVPKVQADLKEFLVLNPAHLGQIGQPLQRLVSQHLDLLVRLHGISEGLNEIDIVAEDGAYCNGELLGESLEASLRLRVLDALEFLEQGATLGCHVYLLHHSAEVEAEFLFHCTLLVLLKLLKGQTAYLRDALDGIDTRGRRLNELADETLNQPVIENVVVRDPRKERLQRAQALLKETVRNAATHILLQYV